MDFFSVIENFMLKMNSMRPVISFTNLFPCMRFGSMKQDTAKKTRIVSVSAIEMRIECVIAIVLSGNPSLHPLPWMWMMRAKSLVLHQFLTMAV
jgi:hypothetical protein